MRRFTCLFFVTIGLLTASPASAQTAEDISNFEECELATDPSDLIRACTAVIGARQMSKYKQGVYTNRGLAYNSLGKLRRAIRNYDQALQSDPQNSGGYFNRTLAYFDLGMPWRALQDFDQAIRLYPGYGQYCVMRGVAHYALGQRKQAMRDYDLAQRLEYREDVHDNRQGFHLCREGDAAGAVADWDQARGGVRDFARKRQELLKKHGFYNGPIDGFL